MGCGGPAAPARPSLAVAGPLAPRPVKIPQQRTLFRRWRGAWRRWSLWTLLVALVISMLATMVWLAGRYEASQVQSRLERDTADAVSDIR
ncbi:MAG: PAS domain-containing sensor histidine kinase, partial [Betaproteobacteria bacterium]